jgi:hypothetical protein
LRITINWDNKKQKVHLSIPGYVNKGLAQFNHTPPLQPQNQPHKHTLLTYGATIQYAKHKDTSKRLSNEEKKIIQQVLGTFMYYGHAVDSTMLTALNSITSTQVNPTEETMENVKLFLDYVVSHQDAVLSYHACNMVSVVHSNASYSSKPKA